MLRQDVDVDMLGQTLGVVKLLSRLKTLFTGFTEASSGTCGIGTG